MVRVWAGSNAHDDQPQELDLTISQGAQQYFCRVLEMIRKDALLLDSITGGQIPMVGQKDRAFVAKGIRNQGTDRRRFSDNDWTGTRRRAIFPP